MRLALDASVAIRMVIGAPLVTADDTLCNKPPAAFPVRVVRLRDSGMLVAGAGSVLWPGHYGLPGRKPPTVAFSIEKRSKELLSVWAAR